MLMVLILVGRNTSMGVYSIILYTFFLISQIKNKV